MSATKALEINNLSVTLGGKKILENISFSIDEGDFLIIIGPNGSGKTTLIKAVLNLVARSGEIKIFGKPANRISSFKGIVGYVPQKFDFDRTFPITVSEAIDVALGEGIKDSEKRKERIGFVLEQVGMAGYARTKIGALSGGQIQRVLIARAIANSPRIVFFDEPLAGVDVKGEKNFYELIQNLKEAQKLTVALVSHDVTVVNLYADKVAALNRILVGFGKPRDVLVAQNMEKVYGQGFGIFRHKECLEKPQEELTPEDIERCKLFGE
ncbi:MAG: metal ABC transporter ATP-binding protein [Actinomycetota bacterium]